MLDPLGSRAAPRIPQSHHSLKSRERLHCDIEKAADDHGRIIPPPCIDLPYPVRAIF